MPSPARGLDLNLRTDRPPASTVPSAPLPEPERPAAPAGAPSAVIAEPPYAEGYGDLSVHEVATSSADTSRLYFSYYSAGFRVAKIIGDEIVETGHFIDSGGSNFWGVQTFQSGGQEYVAASDRERANRAAWRPAPWRLRC